MRFAESRFSDVAFNVLFVACADLRAFAARPALSERFGVPVVTSNQAALGRTSELLGQLVG